MLGLWQCGNGTGSSRSRRNRLGRIGMTSMFLRLLEHWLFHQAEMILELSYSLLAKLGLASNVSLSLT